jgi:hypothetical protein
LLVLTRERREERREEDRRGDDRKRKREGYLSILYPEKVAVEGVLGSEKR